MNAEEIVRQYRQIAPESVSDAKIIETFRRLEGDDDLVQAEIASWWKDESGLEDGSSAKKNNRTGISQIVESRVVYNLV